MAKKIQIPEEHLACINALFGFIESGSKEADVFSDLTDGELEAVFISAVKIFKSRERKRNLPDRRIASNYYEKHPNVFGLGAVDQYMREVHQALGVARKEDIAAIVRWFYPESGSQSNEGDRLRKALETTQQLYSIGLTSPRISSEE
jgi:hypothetical protein